MSRQEIAGLIGAFSDILTMLHNASEADKAEVYGRLGPRWSTSPSTEQSAQKRGLARTLNGSFRVSEGRFVAYVHACVGW